MSEKRRPSIKLVAEICGKDGKWRRVRVELFEASLWPEKFVYPRDVGGRESPRYRVRVDGRWAAGDRTWTLTEVMRQLRKKLVQKRGGG